MKIHLKKKGFQSPSDCIFFEVDFHLHAFFEYIKNAATASRAAPPTAPTTAPISVDFPFDECCSILEPTPTVAPEP